MALKKEVRKKRRNTSNVRKECLEEVSNEMFAYIVGYTSWGFPYGVTWEELEELEGKDKKLVNEKAFPIEELPFD